MFFGLANRDRDQNCATCWPLLEIGFKFLMILSLVMCLVLFIFPDYALYIVIFLPLTIDQYRLWTIFTSFFYAGTLPYGIINVLIIFLILYSCMPDLVHILKFRKEDIQQHTLYSSFSCSFSSIISP